MTASMLQAAYRKVFNAALALPMAYEDHPWGENVAKVKGKVFVFSGASPQSIGFSFKLPGSAKAALALPFASPTGYGLGNKGWVSVKFNRGDDVPVPLLLDWVMESYRAVAPVTALKMLAGGASAPVAAPKKARKKAAKKPVASPKRKRA